MNWPYRRFKLAALLAFLSFYLYVLATTARGEDVIWMWLLFQWPSLAVLFIPMRWFSVARGLALGQSLVFGCITGFIGFIAAVVWLGSWTGGRQLSELTVVFIAQTALFFAAIRIPPELKGMYDRDSRMTWFTTAITVVSLILFMVRAEDISEHSITPDAVYRVVECAESYADHRHGEYPESLATMVQAAKEWFSPNCIYPFNMNGSSNYGQLRYTPIRSANGHIVGYSLLFGPRTFFGNLRTAEYIDQTGIVHEPKNHPIATASDPVRENVSTSLAEWSQCLVKYSQSHPGAPYPAELKDMLNSDWPCKSHRAIEGDHLLPDNNYTVYYKSPSKAKPGDASSFSLQAQPNQYGESGIRSYYVDEDGIVRATLKNRAASKSDAPIPACEWNLGTSCRWD